MNNILKKIPFRTEEYILEKLAYNDCVYAWLLLHSHYNETESHNYIYKEEINFSKIAISIHRSRQTVSKRFKKLIEDKIIQEYLYNGKFVYKLPYFRDFEELHGQTVFQLLCLPVDKQKEELIKTYAWRLKKKRISEKEGKHNFTTSSKEALETFGHSASHSKQYENMRAIFTILQGAGIIKFKTTSFEKREDGTILPPQMIVYEVNDKASDEWLEK